LPATRIVVVITPTSWMTPSTTSTLFVVVAGRSVSRRSNVAPEMLRAPGVLETSQHALDSEDFGDGAEVFVRRAKVGLSLRIQ
jgi:hypothetical protein